MRKKTIDKYEAIFDTVINENITIPQYCQRNNIKVKGLYDYMNNVVKKNATTDIEDRTRLLHKYEIAKLKPEQRTEDILIEEVETDDRAETSYIRDEDGKIKFYKYQIFRKNKTPLFGKLTREEMNTIHRLYSYYGDSLTQRVISRHFVDLSLIDFKRILRAFNITKASAPFAPHMIEECTEDELRNIQLREKENSFLRKAEEDQIKNNEKLLKKYAQENIELKKQIETLYNFKVDFPNVTPKNIVEYEDVNRSINLYISDMHLGSYTISGSLYEENRNYGFKEAKRRLSVVLDKLSTFDCFDTINIVLMGDNVDCCGFTGKTGRLDHTMPSNMDAREQGNKYIELIMWFINSLANPERAITSKIRVFCVPEGNHGSSFEYMCNKALLATINAYYTNIPTVLWDKYYGKFEQSGHTMICLHGKDGSFMKKSMPLNLDDKTKVMLYEWLMQEGINTKNVHFIKGDLHSNALSSCNICDYRNVLSLYGASDYSNYNFSRNAYGISYDLFIGDQIIRGTFENM